MVELPLAFMAIAAFLIPFINAGIQKVNWSPRTKTLIALAVSFLVAVVLLWATGGLVLANLAAAVPMVFAYQHLIYQFILKNVATKFEAITTPGSVVVSQNPDPQLADVTTDATIKATGDNVTVPAPVTVNPAATEIIKDNNVAG
jgi:hypothetical protein